MVMSARLATDMTFDRCYELRQFPLSLINANGAQDWITRAVAARDHPRASASVAAITAGDGYLYVLIEYWREEAPIDGDSEQGAPRTVDPGTTRRQSRRSRARTDDHAGATERDRPPRQQQPLDPTRRVRGAGGATAGESIVASEEIDVQLPTFSGFHEAGCGFWLHQPCSCVWAGPHPDGPVEWPK